MILLSLAKAFLLYIAAAAFIQIDQSIYSQNLHSQNCAIKGSYVSWEKNYPGHMAWLIFFLRIYGILLAKLFWPTMRKNCSSDWEKLLKFKTEGWEFAIIWRAQEQFVKQWKVRTECFLTCSWRFLRSNKFERL